MADASRSCRAGRRGALLGLLSLVGAAALTGAASAAEQQWEVVAEGLANPRHVAVGPAERIYVAEAGSGGVQSVGVTMADGSSPICVGRTGSVTETFRGQSRSLAQFPSWTGGGDGCPNPAAAQGPAGVDVNGRGNLSVSVGLAAPDPVETRSTIADQLEAGSAFGTLQGVLPQGRTLMPADLAQLEATADPDGAGADSNPYGLVILDDGSRVVADAGANALIRADAAGGTDVLAVFAPQCVAWTLPSPNPMDPSVNPCGTQFPAQSVPTDVAVGPDGDYYVSELIGFPFTPGTSRVWRVDAGRSTTATCSEFDLVPNDGCEVHARGLTSVVSIAFGPEDSLYAVQIADGGVLALEQGALDGSVQVIPPGGGSPTAALSGLTAPGGVAVSGDDLYVTNRSIFPDGQLLRTATGCNGRASGPSERLDPSATDD